MPQAYESTQNFFSHNLVTEVLSFSAKFVNATKNFEDVRGKHP